MDQNKIGGVISQLNKSGFGEHIYCALCGRMTPDQKKMVGEHSTLDTQLFIDIMTWFVQNSGHSGFKNISVPEECPQPLLVEDRDANNNTDISIDKNVESSYEGGTYYFSLAQDSSEATCVYSSTEKICFSIISAFCTNVVGIWRYICQHYGCSNLKHSTVCFSFWYWRTKNETKS
jgi:hypothetical protein